MGISIVIPALNEAPVIQATVAAAGAGGVTEIIVVDGGSTDATVALARSCGARVISGPRGRAVQMNAGAAIATGDVLLFLHADTVLPAGFDLAVERELHHPNCVGGRFDVALQPSSFLLWLTAVLLNWRSRMSRIATGDQAIFVRRTVFQRLGGFPEQPLMEDIEFTIALKRVGQVACLREQVVTSSRRWVKNGVVRTILLMWSMRFMYSLGVSAAWLKRLYSDVR